jgi:cyclopropane-fatty-acyl-phospholipid synthase
MAMRAMFLSDDAGKITTHFLNELLRDVPDRNFGIRLWDGTVWGQASRPQFTLVLKNPSALRKMLLEPSQLSLGEAYIFDDIDVEGDISAVFDFGDNLVRRAIGIADKFRLASLLRRLPPAPRPKNGRRSADLQGAIHSKERDRQAIKYHYDLPAEFYSLFLDHRMVYSCAYFSSTGQGIDTAQFQKLDYLCRKLRLQAGERILDLGCGWGGLMMHAAKNYRAHVFGITLSVPQAEYAREKIRLAGLADRCKVEVCDYRELDPPAEFDKIVSVGMFEHVGEALLPEYFKRAYSVLTPGGVFLNHGIAVAVGYERTGPSFIDKYVFPDGELLPLNVTLRAAETVGFEVRDVENLREHYALTLDRWVRNLESRAEQARATAGDVAYRIWRLYMAGSAHAFRAGHLNLFQILLSKPKRGSSGLPLTRADWYCGKRATPEE